eukprot:CAMPEP_0170551848 /NCGR_PEP_ID=MMETSP0211-20121228/9849_1 /TAXON_ID=311385 /ORGANISM="Pseudokeronopsis sp., Strain OXSARD2" /LENGTH=211 /DNA_ID=CAMNT_0010859275 /DNA_START=52 /DNA_END=684 /DNA_ORIENTATION=+
MNGCLKNDSLKEKFLKYATQAPSVCVCRSSPTDKALLVKIVGKYTKKRTCALGDGGNDVSMILEANVGIGLVGKEGKQASLASDYSITHFSHLNKLILWHGRMSYKRACMIANFVIHRGLIIAVIQIVFSATFYYVTISLFTGIQMTGYSSLYINFSIFLLMVDQDISEDMALQYTPLYKTLQNGRNLNLKSFLLWLWIACFQGTILLMGT